MKYGHSVLLMETIAAPLIDYSDCERFQIVCPVCREPVFKAVRESDGHYLSHYVAAKAYAADCELRVMRYTERDVQRDNLMSRGQRLELFLRVLRESIFKFEHCGALEKTETLFRLLSRSNVLECLRGMARRGLEALAQDESAFFAEAAWYIDEDVGADHPCFDTGLERQTQIRIAFDIWRTVCTAQAEANRHFLWNHGYSMCLGRMQSSFDQGSITEPGRKLRRYMEMLIQRSRTGGMAMLAEMARTATPTGFAIAGSNYADKMMGEVAHEMIGCLVRLPYLQILQEQQK